MADLEQIKKQAVRTELPHRRIAYTYSKGTMRVTCSCGWASKVYMVSVDNKAKMEQEIATHKKAAK